jgi:hypothetical protein
MSSGAVVAWIAGSLVAAATLASACSRPPADAAPEGAVRLFLDDMDVAADEPPAMKRAYDLLGPAARANLAERARRTSELQGRQVEPSDMLATGLFGCSGRSWVTVRRSRSTGRTRRPSTRAWSAYGSRRPGTSSRASPNHERTSVFPFDGVDGAHGAGRPRLRRTWTAFAAGGGFSAAVRRNNVRFQGIGSSRGAGSASSCCSSGRFSRRSLRGAGG